MAIKFANSGINYELGLDGSVNVRNNNGATTNFGTWTTNAFNELELTSAANGTVLRQPAAWSTANNIVSVTPSGGSAVDLLQDSGADIDFRIEENQFVVDPAPSDNFSFSLHGNWALSGNNAELQLTLAARPPVAGAPAAASTVLKFDGGLDDSNSCFSWSYETDTPSKKLFALTFDGTWSLAKAANPAQGVVQATFAFSYELQGQTTNQKFSLPVTVGVEPNTNKLLLSYQRTGSTETWGVAFAGKFQTKGGSLIGYSAEVYDDNGEISATIKFDLAGKVSNGAIASANSLSFDLTIQGSKVTVNLAGRYTNLTNKISILFSFTLNASTLTSQKPSITFAVSATFPNGGQLSLKVTIDGQNITVSVKFGTDLALGGSRKGTIYGQLDFTQNGKTVGISAMFGITLN